MTAIITMAWKDIREQLRWGALIGLALSAALIYALRQGSSSDDLYGFAYGMTLLGRTLELVVMVGLPLAGSILGALVVGCELRGDRWSLLMHRPVPQAALFWGKLAGALAIYLVAAGLPTAAALLWISQPGYVPIPFRWTMTLPTVAQFLAGAAYIPAAMAAAARPARWYVSRAFPLAAAPLLHLMSLVAAHQFLPALLILAGGAAVLLAGARHAFLHERKGSLGPVLGRIALALMVLGGGLLLASAILTTITMAFQSPGGPYRSYAVLRDGRVVEVEHLDFGLRVWNSDGGQDPDLKDILDFNKLHAREAPQAHLHASVAPPPSYRSLDYYCTPLQLDGSSGPHFWYFIRETRRVAVYSRDNRRLQGSYGPRGYASASQESAAGFPGFLVDAVQVGPKVVLAFPHALYEIDRISGAVKALPWEDSSEPIRVLATTWSEQHLEDNPDLVILTERRLVVMPAQGGTAGLNFTLPPDFQAQSTTASALIASFYRPQGEVVLLDRLGWRTAGRVDYRVFMGNSTTGQFHEREKLPPQEVPSSPIAMEVLAGLVGLLSLLRVFVQEWQNQEPPILVAIVSAVAAALLAAIVCWWLAQRSGMGRGRLVLWTSVGAFLGVLGPLLLLCVEELPAREPCRACRSMRPVSQAICRRCGTAVAAVEADGSEVFATLSSPAVAAGAAPTGA